MDQIQDNDHLRMLSIFHYILGGIFGCLSLLPLMHVAVGIAILNGKFDSAVNGPGPPEIFGWIFVVFPLCLVLLGLTLAVCVVIAGRKLSRRTGYLYCLVVAGIECTCMPFGTILGVFTILVLMRPSVKKLFGVPVLAASATTGAATTGAATAGAAEAATIHD